MRRDTLRVCQHLVREFFSRSFKFPGIDDQQLGEDGWSTEGELSGIDSTWLMELMYGARTMRWDLLQPSTTLAQDAAEWDHNCDIRVRTLFCYAAQTCHHSMEAFCGDSAQELRSMVYCDASFADCVRTHKSRPVRMLH